MVIEKCTDAFRGIFFGVGGLRGGGYAGFIPIMKMWNFVFFFLPEDRSRMHVYLIFVFFQG